MKILDGGEEIIRHLNSVQLSVLKKLLTMKIEEDFKGEEKGRGLMVFSGLKDTFGYDSLYVEFFFYSKEQIQGTNKIIMYDGDMPDPVLDAISQLKKEHDESQRIKTNK